MDLTSGSTVTRTVEQCGLTVPHHPRSSPPGRSSAFWSWRRWQTTSDPAHKGQGQVAMQQGVDEGAHEGRDVGSSPPTRPRGLATSVPSSRNAERQGSVTLPNPPKSTGGSPLPEDLSPESQGLLCHFTDRPGQRCPPTPTPVTDFMRGLGC
jgi:hypothetical protein